MNDPTQIPDPPLLVLAKAKGRKKPFWYYSVRAGHDGPRFCRVDFHDWEWAKNLRVVMHPRNDRRAVEIIRAAAATKTARTLR